MNFIDKMFNNHHKKFYLKFFKRCLNKPFNSKLFNDLKIRCNILNKYLRMKLNNVNYFIYCNAKLNQKIVNVKKVRCFKMQFIPAL